MALPGHNLTVSRARRLSQRDRLVYCFDDDRMSIFAIGGHYGDE